ncbi:MAG: 16S rRNA (uracil(1498)-N(3))-methyltransferase [Actinobacteria bacterium]|nr:16S rRNA (uracil(1498)-N(3))-methyltransferase [Actinomycetota bacterium]
MASLKLAWAAREHAAAHVLVDGMLSESLQIGGDDAHHLARVRRLRAGERVTVSDGSGRWRPYRIVAVTRSDLTLEGDGSMRMEPGLLPRLHVAFALTKGQKPETVVARLTELGVDEITPLLGGRSVVQWDTARIATAADRFGRVAREAALQSRRTRLPRIGDPMPLEHLRGVAGVVLAHPDGGPAEDLPEPGDKGWTLVVGPEGGLADEELEAMEDAPRLALGPHVLRAETAAVAGAAVLTAGRRPSHAVPKAGVPPAGGHGG